MSAAYVIHENPDWLPPLRAALERAGVSWTDWFTVDGPVDLAAAPPQGVFYNRMSASSFTREHPQAPEITAVLLAWLRRHGRRVINGPRAVELEVSKPKQYAALAEVGIATPRTIVAASAERLIAASEAFAGQPVILKPARGGKGAGVLRFDDGRAAAEHVRAHGLDSVDGLGMLQEYVAPRDNRITRLEFVGGRFLYAVSVDVTNGFELCPADVCEIPGARTRPAFEILDGFDEALIGKAERFLAANDIEIGAIEVATTADGRHVAYDVNTNTNYNSDAEAADGIAGTPQSGMGAIAHFLKAELALNTTPKARAFAAS